MRTHRFVWIAGIVFLRVCLRRLFGRSRRRGWSIPYEAAVQLLLDQGRRMHDWPAQDIRRTIPDAKIPQRIMAQMTVERGELGEVPVECITPVGWSREHGEILYLHGGGYAVCSPGSHRGIGCGLAKASGARVHMLDYRLAPEHPYPAALEDASRAYVALRAKGEGVGDIIVAGDSAGGGLSVALTQSVIARGEQRPAGLVLFSPWLDLTRSTKSIDENARYDYLQPEQIERYADWYLQGHDPSDPLVSPVSAKLSGFPPIWVAYGDSEALRDEAVAFISRLDAAGIACERWVGAGMVHMWQAFAPISRDARHSIRGAGRWVTAQMGQLASRE